MRTSFVFGVSAVILLGGVAMAQPAPPAPPRAPGAEMPPPPPPGPGPRHDMAPPPPKGAHFKLRIDEQRVDVKCADDEPMKACADIVMQMAERVFGPRSAPAPRP